MTSRRSFLKAMASLLPAAAVARCAPPLPEPQWTPITVAPVFDPPGHYVMVEHSVEYIEYRPTAAVRTP